MSDALVLFDVDSGCIEERGWSALGHIDNSERIESRKKRKEALRQEEVGPPASLLQKASSSSPLSLSESSDDEFESIEVLASATDDSNIIVDLPVQGAWRGEIWKKLTYKTRELMVEQSEGDSLR